MDEKALADLIHPVGFYNTKAKNIKKAAALLLEKWDGEVPVNETDLVTLPGACLLAAAACAAACDGTCISCVGVGPKMAMIVINVGSTFNPKCRQASAAAAAAALTLFPFMQREWHLRRSACSPHRKQTQVGQKQGTCEV